MKNYEIETGDYVDVYGNECIKVITGFPDQVKRLRNKIHALGYQTYEADVPFVRRWMIDLGIRVSPKPRILYFDVEADSRVGIWVPTSGEPPTQRIISIAAIDEDEREYFISEDDEHEIFHKFMKLLGFYDLAVGYNNFRWDNPYLEARAKVLGVDYDPKIVRWQDMMLLYNKAFGGGYVSLRLDAVAQRELGVGKKFSLYERGGAEAIWRMFKENREALKEYNLWDATLLKMLNEKTGCLTVAVEMAHTGYGMYEDALYNSRIIDGLVLRKSYERSPRIVWPTRAREEDDEANIYGTYARGETRKKNENPYTGGLVIDPVPGLHFNVLNFDYTQLYPRIMMTFNIGIETLDDNGDIHTAKKRFKSKPRPLFVELIDELDKQRSFYKEELARLPKDDPRYKIYNVKQFEIKILLNSISGAIGSRAIRFHNRDVAESITLTGRELLKMLNSILEERGFQVLYSDTDGTFVKRPDLTLEKIFEIRDDLVKEVNEILRERVIKRFNVPPEYYRLHVKLDKIYSRIFFTGAKKRYAGMVVDTANTYLDTWRERFTGAMEKDIVGFDAIRLDAPNIVKKAQERLFDIIFTASDEAEIRKRSTEFLKHLKELLLAGELDEELTMEKTAQSRLDRYKVMPVHVLVAKELMAKGLFRPGDSVVFVITDVKDGRLVGAPVITGQPFPKITQRGYNYYWERVLQMAERTLGYKINAGRSLMEWL